MMRYVTATNALLFVLALLIPGTCAAQRGKISDGTYISPLNNFAVPVPRGIGTRVQDQGDDHGGIVAFHDDFGGFKSIFYLRLSADTLKIQNDPEKQRTNLKAFLSEFAMPHLFKPASPQASILHEEQIDAGDYNAHFAILELPEGSTMYDARAKKRYDTKRGLLVFVKDAFIYMLSNGENPAVLDLGKPKTLDELLESEKKNLLSFKSVITFK